MQLMAPTDSMFLVPESKDQPMHVGGLQVFEYPADAGKGWLRDLYERAVAETDVAPTFRKRPHRSLATLGQWTWVTDGDLDLEHHVRHSALPEPGRVRELLALVSRLHSTPLSYDRPLWESHLIEGLEGNRFAVYTKVHHALMDGISASRLLQRSLSPDQAVRDQPLPWSPDYVGRGTVVEAGNSALAGLLGLPRAAVGTVYDALGLAPRVLKIAADAVRSTTAVLPLQAPRSPLNVAITGSRRFAADGWSIERMRTVAKAGDATINDVVLAMVSSALRDYFTELGTLPGSSMVAMTPISLRAKDDGDAQGGGNAVGAILCTLGTDIADPVERLRSISSSMRSGKGALAGLSQLQVSALSAVVMAPLLVNYVTGLHAYTRPAFNLVVSNVPGPATTLYWNGARLSGSYPLSIPLNGQALNVTVTSYDGEMQFGLIGCRRTLPSLQKMLVGLEDGLAALEAALLPDGVSA